MNTQYRVVAVCLVMASLLVVGLAISGCGPTPTPPPTPTLTPAPPTATPTPALPTYSEVIGTYPEGTEINCTDTMVSKVTSDGAWTFAGGTTCSCGGTPFIKCYGAKVTIVDNDVTIDGVTYPPDAKLTVDKDLNWIEVSSWD